jgi:hypothetical protein
MNPDDLLYGGFLPIETAPKGCAPTVEMAPSILLLFKNDVISVGFWDWRGRPMWREPITGERLDAHFDEPLGWMPLPAPTMAGEGESGGHR